jgi:hypothetical protein
MRGTHELAEASKRVSPILPRGGDAAWENFTEHIASDVQHSRFELSPASTSTFTLSCRTEIEVLHAIWQSRSPPYVSTTKIKYARMIPRHAPRTTCIIDTMCSFSFSLSATRSFLLAPAPSPPVPTLLIAGEESTNSLPCLVCGSCWPV